MHEGACCTLFAHYHFVSEVGRLRSENWYSLGLLGPELPLLVLTVIMANAGV